MSPSFQCHLGSPGLVVSSLLCSHVRFLSLCSCCLTLQRWFNISKAGGFWLLYQTRDSENRGHTFWSCSFRQCLAFRIELMAAHSKTLVWELPWTEQPGELQSMVSVARSRTQLHFHFSLSRIGEGNGNPLQYSCLEKSRDGGAWWADVCGVRVGDDWRDLAAAAAAA